MTESRPLPISSRLAKTPSSKPQFGVELTYRGQPLLLSDPKACRAMVALMDMGAVLGGAASHYGGPAALAEMVSVCYALAFQRAQEKKREWYEEFHLINDAGHCENLFYAVKANYGFAKLDLKALRGFRSIQSPLTGHGEVHRFPEGVYLSNGPLGSSLPQAQGLAFADRLAGIQRTTIAIISDGACFEGEAKEAFAAIAGLAQKGRLNPFVSILSDNNTKLSGRIDEQAFSLQPMFRSFREQGWCVIHLEDGNNLSLALDKIDEAISIAESNPYQPVLVHAKTLKGIGTKSTADSSSGGHGFPLKDTKSLREFVTEIFGDSKVPGEFLNWVEELIALDEKVKRSPADPKPSMVAPETRYEKIQVGVGKALVRKREEGLPIVCITSDLPGSTGTQPFGKAFPRSFVDVGVAEANMVSMAVGLSKVGYIPVVDTFSQFGTTKGALPLIMASLSQAPLIAIYSHTGFQDAADGASHQAISYFAMTSAIPHVDVYALTSSMEAETLISQAVDRHQRTLSSGGVPSSSIFFLGREDFASRWLPENYDYQLGKAQLIMDTSKSHSECVLIVAAGSLLQEALLASERLSSQGFGALVVNPSIINRPDLETILPLLKKSKGRLVTVEDHHLSCGMGSQLVHTLALAGEKFSLRSLGIKEFGQSAYKALELYQKHQLDSEAIALAGLELLK